MRCGKSPPAPLCERGYWWRLCGLRQLNAGLRQLCVKQAKPALKGGDLVPLAGGGFDFSPPPLKKGE